MFQFAVVGYCHQVREKMRLVGLLSFMVDHLQTAQGALASVLFLKGVGPADCKETGGAKEMKYSLGTVSSGRCLHMYLFISSRSVHITSLQL